MNKKKVLKIIASIIGAIIIIIGVFIAYVYYSYTRDFNTENKPYKNYIGYIDQEKALLNDVYELCGEGNLYHTYSSAALKAFKGSKKQFRDTILAEYNHQNYTDSGYLNFRFLVNCEGNAGWFEIIQMNLDLEETLLNEKMVNELLELTSNPKHWNIISYNDAPQNYYMYISYRIEHGKITEIIP